MTITLLQKLNVLIKFSSKRYTFQFLRGNKFEFTEKRKRSVIDELFGESLFDETKLFEEFQESRYSISVMQTSEGSKVRAKVGKDTDTNALRKQLQKQYPNARIEIEGGKKEPLIREISTKTFKNENNEKQKHE